MHLNYKMLIFLVMVAIFMGVTAAPILAAPLDNSPMVMMNVSLKENEKHLQWYEASPKVIGKYKNFNFSYDLTGYIPYIPNERNQGATGTCWVWTGTAGMELDHSRDYSIMDRFSIQFFDSKYNGGQGPFWAGSDRGGTPEQFANFYNKTRIVVPWSNVNASYQDGAEDCVIQSKSWSIITNSPVMQTPHYDVAAIEVYPIKTDSVSQETAIANIKYALLHGGSVWFLFALPDGAKDFKQFWQYQNEDVVFDLDSYDGHFVFKSEEHFQHAVLCVGYDTASDSWLMLNSWPIEFDTGTLRPNNLFRVKMHSNYSASLHYQPDSTFPGAPPYDLQPIQQWYYQKTLYGKITLSAVHDTPAIFNAGLWYIDLNKDGKFSERDDLLYRFGQAGDIPVPGRWVRGKGTVAAVFRRGDWIIDSNGNGKYDPTVDTVYRGLEAQRGDIPVVGDWNGDGLDEAGVYQNGKWYLDKNRDGAFDPRNDIYYPRFGGNLGDIPLAGRWYVEDNRDYPWIYRASSDTWLIDTSMDGVYSRDIDLTIKGFGCARGKPIIGDWNGDGSDYPGFYSYGNWKFDLEPPYGTFSRIDLEISGFGFGESVPILWQFPIAV